MQTRFSSVSESYQSVENSTTRTLSREFPRSANWRDVLSKDVDAGANATLDQRKLFTTVDHTTPSYVTNTDFWLKGYEQAFTCRAPYSEEAGDNHRLTTAVTPRHAVSAWHSGYTPNVGTTVRFVTTDNTVIERTVVQQSSQLTWNDPISGPVDTDIGVILLDSDLPSTITPCKIFPSAYKNILHDVDQTSSSSSLSNVVDRVEKPRIALVACDQEHKTHPFTHQTFRPNRNFYDKIWAVFYGLNNDSLYDYPHDQVTGNYPSWKRTWGRWFVKPESIVAGDSGNPIFCAVNKELWLVSLFFGASTGPFYANLIPEVNAAIAALDTAQGINTGYTLTEGNLLDL